jgi:peroxiredoxin
MVKPEKKLVRILVRFIFALSCAALFCGCAKEQVWKIGERAPAISMLDLNDKTVKLSDFRGKPVILRFWATGCQACVASMPALDDFRKKYQGGELVVLAVNMGNSKPLVQAFAKGLKLSYPVLLDEALIASQKYAVRAVPTTFFIDRKGTARKVVVGDLKQEVFDQTVAELL